MCVCKMELQIKDLVALVDGIAKDGTKGISPGYFQKVLASHGLEAEAGMMELWEAVRDVRAFLATEKMPAGWPSPRAVTWACESLLVLAQAKDVHDALVAEWGADAHAAMLSALEAEKARLKADVKRKPRASVDEEHDDLEGSFDDILGGELVTRAAAVSLARWAVHRLAAGDKDKGVYGAAIGMLLAESDGVPRELVGLVQKLLKV